MGTMPWGTGPAGGGAAGNLRMQAAGVCLLVLGSLLAYLPFAGMPMISDTYLQIALARDYGAPGSWSSLALDPLYRCRGTSLFFTYLVDTIAGPSAVAHRVASFVLHLANSLLLVWVLARFGLAARTAMTAAVIFAACEVHQEAVIWVAALPELLVMTFLLLGLAAWKRALETGRAWAFLGAAAAYSLALASKESGVVFVPLAALIWLHESPGGWRSSRAADRTAWWALAAMGFLAAVYTFVIISTGDEHLHLTDGTFSLRAPFLKVQAISITRILLPWGFVALAVLLHARRFREVGGSLVWLCITLLPYSFLLYQARVPSRHTYLASAALAFLLGSAAAVLWRSPRRWLAPALLGLFLAQNIGWMWTRKADQYSRRAASTERFLTFARESAAPVRITCAPYGIDVYRSAARLILRRGGDQVLGAAERPEVEARSFCDPIHP